MAESDIDRNAEDGFHLAVSTAPGKYLGDPTVVDRLVRAFLQGVFQSRALFQEDGDGPAATARIEHLAREYGTIFLGQSEAYTAMPWNSPNRLGMYLHAAVEDAGDFASDGEAYFHFLALQALAASMSVEDGSMSEDEVKAGMTEVVEDAVEVLLGRKAGGAP